MMPVGSGDKDIQISWQTFILRISGLSPMICHHFIRNANKHIHIHIYIYIYIYIYKMVVKGSREGSSGNKGSTTIKWALQTGSIVSN